MTSGYVKTDFSVIDRLNAKILGYVFEEKNEKKMEIICGLKNDSIFAVEIASWILDESLRSNFLCLYVFGFFFL